MRKRTYAISRMLLVLALAAVICLMPVSPTLPALRPSAGNCALYTTVPAPAAAPPTVKSSRTWTDDSPFGYGTNVLIQEMYLYAPPRLDMPVSYPPELDYIPYLRYAVNDGTSSASADAVVVALSGLHAGNNGFDYFAKQLVSKAYKDRGMHVEVWALDRRVNNLEDTTGLNKAEELGRQGKREEAARVILDYYYHGAEVDGKKFQGFLTNETARYLSEFGLRVFMEDIYTLICTVFPDQSVRKKKVYVAGDSLGAVLAADFACWDFDGNAATTADIGYNNIAGVIALDALMTPNAIPINQDVLRIISNFLPSIFQNLINMTSLTTYEAVLTMLRVGGMPVLLPTSEIGYVPETYVGVEVNAMMADAAPDEESTFYRDTAGLDVDPRTDVILRLCMSRDLLHFLSGEVYQKKVRFTNEALFGIVFDNNFNPITMNQCAYGFLSGPVSEKSFPGLGNLDAILPGFLWYPISGFMPYDRMYIPSSTTYLYKWVNSDEIESDPYASRYTSSSDEVSNLHDVAKCCYEGPSNIAEWYYTTRMFADIMIANTAGAERFGLNLLHADDLSKVPTFIRLNREGTNIGYAKMNGMNTSGMELPGQHLDVLMMDMDRDPNAKNLMYLPMCDWIIKTSGISPTPPSGLAVTGITPNSGYWFSWRPVSVTVTGAGFASGATVRLVRGSTTISAGSVKVVSSSQITCTFNLWLKPTGTYDVVVRNSDGKEARLVGGFTVY